MSTSPRTRLSPDQRRRQLLDLGVRLFARFPIEALSIDVLAQEAGISRGLLYHYFGDKLGFREAVVRRAAADMVEKTRPPAEGEPGERLLASVAAYVDWVDANYEGYLSLVRGAASDAALRAVYDDARTAITDLVFTEDVTHELIADTPAARLLVRGWQALVEELVLAWKAGETPVSRDELLEMVVGTLPAIATVLAE